MKLEVRLQCDRAFEGAEITTGPSGKLATPCFNVTALLKARKSSSQIDKMEYELCFNVTALLKARKFRPVGTKNTRVPVLQCDRAFEGAEIAPSWKRGENKGK